MYFCVKQDLGRLMLDTSLIVDTVNCMEVHDPLTAGKVRAQNENPHQHLPRTEISVWQCYSQFWLAAFVIPSSKPTGKIKLKRRAFLDSTSGPAPRSHTRSSYLTELLRKNQTCGKGLPVQRKDPALPQHVLALLGAFGGAHMQSPAFTQVAEDHGQTAVMGSSTTGLQVQSYKYIFPLRFSACFVYREKEMLYQNCFKIGVTFTMSLELNSTKISILYQNLTDRTGDLICSSEEEMQVLYIYIYNFCTCYISNCDFVCITEVSLKSIYH